MKRISITLTAVLALGGLSACTEKPQTGGGVTHDAAPYAGTGSNFTQPGWKAGDKASWEQQLKARQQYSQNEYTRTQ
ncbi:hypothetical protein [Acidovorax sp.]|jgi:hypothetical protein|uniref:hypothetical protein n=1 Tax=Acidovorax sp. TaxID=1872122 RepID=UPI0025B8A3F0|nr:hypothetical protein [Acidovorax sp.]